MSGPSMATTTPPSSLESMVTIFWSPLNSFTVCLLAIVFSSISILLLALATGLLLSSTNAAFTTTTQLLTSIEGGATKNRVFFASAFSMNPISATLGLSLLSIKPYPLNLGSISCFWYLSLIHI